MWLGKDFTFFYAACVVVADGGKPVVAADNDNHAGERVSLNKVQIDGDVNSTPRLDLTGSTDPDADDSEVSTEPDADDDVDNTDSTHKKRKKISTLPTCSQGSQFPTPPGKPGFFSWKFQDPESPGKSLWSWKILEAKA